MARPPRGRPAIDAPQLTPGLRASLAPVIPVALWMSGALLAFCGLAVTMRGLSKVMGPFEINAVRTGGGLCAAVAYMACTGRRPHVLDGRNMRDHVTRNLVHWGASLLWTLSVSVLPLATVFSIEFTTPIWVAAIAAAFLGVRTSGATLSAMVLGLAGVVVVVHPSASSLSAYVALPVVTAMGLALASLLTKRLTRRNAVLGIVFWMMLLQFLANACVVACTVGVGAFASKVAADWGTVASSLLLVCCGLASQVCLTKALRLGNPTMVVSLDFLRIPLISAIGYVLYGETLGINTLLGTLAIVAAVLVITAEGGRSSMRAAAASELATA